MLRTLRHCWRLLYTHSLRVFGSAPAAELRQLRCRVPRAPCTRTFFTQKSESSESESTLMHSYDAALLRLLPRVSQPRTVHVLLLYWSGRRPRRRGQLDKEPAIYLQPCISLRISLKNLCMNGPSVSELDLSVSCRAHRFRYLLCSSLAFTDSLVKMPSRAPAIPPHVYWKCCRPPAL